MKLARSSGVAHTGVKVRAPTSAGEQCQGGAMGRRWPSRQHGRQQPSGQAGWRWVVVGSGGSGERSTGDQVSVRIHVVGLSREPYSEC
jgi:hypothetical protein